MLFVVGLARAHHTELLAGGSTVYLAAADDSGKRPPRGIEYESSSLQIDTGNALCLLHQTCMYQNRIGFVSTFSPSDEVRIDPG